MPRSAVHGRMLPVRDYDGGLSAVIEHCLSGHDRSVQAAGRPGPAFDVKSLKRFEWTHLMEMDGVVLLTWTSRPVVGTMWPVRTYLAHRCAAPGLPPIISARMPVDLYALTLMDWPALASDTATCPRCALAGRIDNNEWIPA